MPISLDILAPAGFVPLQAVASTAPDGKSVAVDGSNPLPIATQASRAAGSTPLTGAAAATTTTGPFTPQLGREIVLTLSGTFSATVTLLRSVDGGTTKLPATVNGTALSWTGAVNEIVWVETEAAATLYLQITLTSGTVTYRVAQ